MNSFYLISSPYSLGFVIIIIFFINWTLSFKKSTRMSILAMRLIEAWILNGFSHLIHLWFHILIYIKV